MAKCSQCGSPCTSVRNPEGEVTNYVATFTDITERKAAESEIEYLAFYDQLTRLPNRRLLLDRLQQALAASAQAMPRARCCSSIWITSRI